MRYMILGAGFQGRACAFDLLRNPGVDGVVLCDLSRRTLSSAKTFLARVSRRRAHYRIINAGDPAAVARAAKGFDALISCVPYFYNLALADAAISSRVSFVDLGGSTEIVRKELALHKAAKRARVCVLPDNGLGPGMISTLAVHVMSLLDRTDEVLIYDGGLPQKPAPPLNYLLTFSEHGLINEYAGMATCLINGKVAKRPALSDLEVIELPGLGRLEAGHAAGGLSTLAETHRGKVKTMFNKFLRYPGHITTMAGLRAMGLFDTKSVEIRPGVKVSPRELAAKLFRRHFHRPGDEDIVVVHIIARGLKDGRPARVILDLVDRYDREYKMTAMMRTTAFPASIVAQMAASGLIKPGAWTVEEGVPPGLFIEEIRKRGFSLECNFVRL